MGSFRRVGRPILTSINGSVFSSGPGTKTIWAATSSGRTFVTQTYPVAVSKAKAVPVVSSVKYVVSLQTRSSPQRTNLPASDFGMRETVSHTTTPTRIAITNVFISFMAAICGLRSECVDSSWSSANHGAVPPSDPRRLFGNRVRELRLQRKFSQEKLAESADLYRNYVGGVERSERNVSLLNIVKLARGLKVRPSELIEPTKQRRLEFLRQRGAGFQPSGSHRVTVSVCWRTKLYFSASPCQICACRTIVP
jgi:transcriptional regulator with XRE-family HTH domain